MRESQIAVRWKDEGRVEGRVEALRETVLTLGRQRFGEPKVGTAERLCQISDLEQLRRLTPRLLTANAWDDLLAAS